MYPPKSHPQGNPQPSDGFEGDMPALFLEINKAASCLRDCEENLRQARMALDTQVTRLNDLQAIFDTRVHNWRLLAPDVSDWGQKCALEHPVATARVR